MNEEKPNTLADTFFGKLKEQSFTIILLVGILWYQNNTYKSNLEEYKAMIDQKENLILKLVDEERNRLIEKNQYLQEQRDKYVEDLIQKNK
jgi:hypothetical protein